MIQEKINEWEISDKVKLLYPKFNIIKNEDKPYTLYKLNDIGRQFTYTNLNVMKSRYLKDEIVILKYKTPGGIQNVSFISHIGMCKLLCKTRKNISDELIEIFNIDIYRNKYTFIESDTIDCIIKTFQNEEYNLQYSVLQYKIDIYFPKYNLAIECDEFHYDKTNDKIRENNIIEKINCKFIRYTPYSKDFDIFNLLNQIFTHIKLHMI